MPPLHTAALHTVHVVGLTRGFFQCLLAASNLFCILEINNLLGRGDQDTEPAVSHYLCHLCPCRALTALLCCITLLSTCSSCMSKPFSPQWRPMCKTSKKEPLSLFRHITSDPSLLCVCSRGVHVSDTVHIPQHKSCSV